MLFFDLIQVAIGQLTELSCSPSEEEWYLLYNEAIKQSVLGIAFEGVQKLPKEQWPPQALLFEWIGVSEQIKQQNRLVNKRTSEVSKLFEDAGLRSCILKGQGNAIMYSNPYSRTSGDVDIWVDGDRKAIHDFVVSRAKNAKDGDMHITMPDFNDVMVEVHFKPRYMNTPRYDKCLMLFFDEHHDEQFEHKVALPDGAGQIAVPTAEFNIVYQMSHLMGHFFVEGIGLRQFIDYYYVLKAYKNEIHRSDMALVLQQTGMMKFAKGVMWVQKAFLGMNDEYLIVEPDEKVGKLILREMLEGGNFGHYDERYKGREKGMFARGLTDTYRLLKLIKYFPSESIWKIIKKIDNQKWKLKGA